MPFGSEESLGPILPDTAAGELRGLQCAQLWHDTHYHLDVWSLKVPARLNHYVLHLIKYIGDLADCNQYDSIEVTNVLIDMSIILTCMSNAVNLDIYQNIYTKKLAAYSSLSTLQNNFDKICNREMLTEFALKCISVTGKMAKALDKNEHLEKFDSRTIIENNIGYLMNETLMCISYKNINMKDLYINRLRDIEERSIFKQVHGTL